MKILVLSDSHSTLSFMRRCIDAVQPQAVIHLGDHYDDGTALAEEYPQIPFYQVPGNCDAHRCFIPDPETRMVTFGNHRFLITHGHRHHVKQTLIRLLADARASAADVVLFGHTHVPTVFEKDGVVFLNPGSTSIPKENSPHSYVIYENGVFSWKSLEDGGVYKTYSLE